MRQEIMLEDKAQKCVALARSQRAKLAVAESCSGGLIGAALSAIPGASDVFLGGVIAYDNVVKTEVLRIDPALLQAHGAVSVPVARAMAKGAQDLLKADFAVAVTGIAGPSGDSSNKPVGLVHIAACGLEYICLDQECRLGDIGRDAVRQGAVCAAIELLCAALESAAAG